MVRTIKRDTSRLLIALMALVMLLALFITPAYAAGTYKDYYSEGNYTDTTLIGNDIIGDIMQGGTDVPSALKNKITAIAKDNEDSAGTSISGGYQVSQAGMDEIKRTIAEHAKNQKVKEKVNNMGTDFSIEADTEGAAKTLSGIRSVTAMIVGLLCYLITLGMTLFTAIDLCYITMPVFRNKCEDMKQSGNGAMVKTNSKTGETQIRWITDEAVYAVQSAALETGKSPLTIYLKKRILAFVILGIVLFILFTGNIQLIVNIAINFVSGVMDALSSLGS